MISACPTAPHKYEMENFHQISRNTNEEKEQINVQMKNFLEKNGRKKFIL
jgi:hypothetical protein